MHAHAAHLEHRQPWKQTSTAITISRVDVYKHTDEDGIRLFLESESKKTGTVSRKTMTPPLRSFGHNIQRHNGLLRSLCFVSYRVNEPPVALPSSAQRTVNLVQLLLLLINPPRFLSSSSSSTLAPSAQSLSNTAPPFVKNDAYY